MEGPPPEVIHQQQRIILEIFRLNLFYYVEDCNLSVFNKAVVGSSHGDVPKYAGVWHCAVGGVRPTDKMSHMGPSKWLIPRSLKIFGDMTSDMPHSMCIINPIRHFL